MYWNEPTYQLFKTIGCRLTLTWDVLKSGSGWAVKNYRHRLTLTWDVLKYMVNYFNRIIHYD